MVIRGINHLAKDIPNDSNEKYIFFTISVQVSIANAMHRYLLTDSNSNLLFTNLYIYHIPGKHSTSPFCHDSLNAVKVISGEKEPLKLDKKSLHLATIF